MLLACRRKLGHALGRLALSDEPFKSEWAEELEVLWNLYYRVAEPIFALGAEEVSEEVDAFFVRMHTLAERMKALEARWVAANSNRHKADEYYAKEPLRQQVIAERKAAIADIAKMREEADALLKALEEAGSK